MSGGKKEWIGISLLSAHKGKCIQEEDFKVFLSYVRAAIKEHVRNSENAEILIKLASGLRKDIVEDKS